MGILVRSVAIAVPLAIAAGCTAEVERPNFVERFERIDDRVWMVSDGWTNGAFMINAWVDDQVQAGPDGLTVTFGPITQRVRDRAYGSGEIRTHRTYLYGYFEARLRATRGSGLDNAFFTYTEGTDGEPSSEIDVEILGKDTTFVEFAYHYGDDAVGVRVPLGFDAAEGWHVYGFAWEPDSIRWYVDGVQVHEERGERLPLPATPHAVFAHLFGSDVLIDWAGPFEPSQAPRVMAVACLAAAPEYPGAPICQD